MIQTKKAIWNSRDKGICKYKVVIDREDNYKEEEKFNYVIKDYELFEDGTENLISIKVVTYTYTERDTLKDYLVNEYQLQGTESVINKILLPYALMAVIQQNTIRGIASNEWEFSEQANIRGFDSNDWEFSE